MLAIYINGKQLNGGLLIYSLRIIQQLQDLNIDIEYVRKTGPEGHTNRERTIQMVQKLSKETRIKLSEVFRLDFTLFGYNWRKYLND